ncbi:nucleolar protein 8 isoform X2 [Monomorium pharaonis]|uniref:nucleolar protein 8 isoform X2 n=1 Tax=Monomorium pharaonis TaxID=307658 RepID=UPI001746600B|nr:nucleolar protein 8 isoform X2 [Monomorium pharaonis]
MSVITESEKKRLRSLKERKQAFKAKGQVIQQALRNLDNTTKNKKIIFDDVDTQQNSKLKEKTKRLFDSDDDNNEMDSLWNKDEFKVKKSKKATLGNDVRFTLDERFTEDNCETEKSKVIEDEECNLQREKEKQLDILESILGTPLTIKSQETKPAKQGLMIRYDPTENGHDEYEVKSVQPETKQKNTKKKKHDKSTPEIEKSAPPVPEVSKDIYYAVSDTLVESLKTKEKFSLLKTHGKEKNDTENSKDNAISLVENNKVQKFKFNFNVNNTFKYDSSDDENIHEDEAPDVDNHIVDVTKENSQQKNSLFQYENTLFFNSSDVRFNEAIKFFGTTATSNHQLNNLRPELKAIVRKKIRNNEKRHQPFGKKRKIEKS